MASGGDDLGAIFGGFVVLAVLGGLGYGCYAGTKETWSWGKGKYLERAPQSEARKLVTAGARARSPLMVGPTNGGGALILDKGSVLSDVRDRAAWRHRYFRADAVTTGRPDGAYYAKADCLVRTVKVEEAVFSEGGRLKDIRSDADFDAPSSTRKALLDEVCSDRL